ncbi:MAG TPA: hypothetical protein VGE13_04510 [Candidatus Saccharimonadales bacterium]
MGLFQANKKAHDKTPIDETADGVKRFFEDYFQDLRSRGHFEFHEISEAKKEKFTQDLDATVAQASDELRQHIADQLGRMFVENSKVMQAAQEVALESISHSSEELQEQHRELSKSLQKNIADQHAALDNVFAENTQQLEAMKRTQAEALEALQRTAEELKEQQQQLKTSLDESIAKQQAAMVAAFEENMAAIIERYLLGAIGDQYDLKAQLPSIIKQMESQKQAITDDMKL